MSTKAVNRVLVHAGARGFGVGRLALAVPFVLGLVGCGQGSPAGPPLPGSILLTTQTSGFLPDDSYELLVDGISKGVIGANDATTIADLDPATYEVSLGDVATNCVVDATSVAVTSQDEAPVALTVTCAPADPESYTLRFDRDRPNLDTGELEDCLFGICPAGADYDIYAYYSSGSTPHSIIRQDTAHGVEIAHVPGATLSGLTEADYTSAVFTTSLVNTPFDTGRVILIRTDQGNVYALGNPSENTMALTLTFDAALIISGP